MFVKLQKKRILLVLVSSLLFKNNSLVSRTKDEPVLKSVEMEIINRRSIPIKIGISTGSQEINQGLCRSIGKKCHEYRTELKTDQPINLSIMDQNSNLISKLRFEELNKNISLDVFDKGIFPHKSTQNNISLGGLKKAFISIKNS